MRTTSSHVAPLKVTITSRPKTAAADGGGAAPYKSGSNRPVLAPAIAQQQPYENGWKNKTSNKLSTSVPASTHANTSLFAAPTRPPPFSVRPKSSSSSSSTVVATTRGVLAASIHSAIASPHSGASLAVIRAYESSFRGAKAAPLGTACLSSSAVDVTGNIHHAMVARKSAEDTATQLARRIAHFRVQEERVLREVQDVKSKLESALLVAHQQHQASASVPQQGDEALWPAIGSPQRRPLHGWAEKNGSECVSNTQSRREPRSREQLKFLTEKQRKVLQMRKLESAKHQKEKRKLALETQKLKEEADKHSKVAQKAKIRQEYQRVTKQHQLLESLEGQHEQRLQIEKEREHRARGLIEQLREEEKHVALRLQALKFHQEFIKRSGLSGGE